MPKRFVNLVHPDLSYAIVGKAFDVYNDLGHGHKEQLYQKALATSFGNSGIPFKEQVYCPVVFYGERIGSYYLDFLIADKVVIELKTGERFLKQNIGQVYSYLRANNLPLGILINFTRDGVRFKRIVNIK